MNPASASAPAKLRVLYEVGPIAYLIEKAGGKSSDGENSALDIKIPTTEVSNPTQLESERDEMPSAPCLVSFRGPPSAQVRSQVAYGSIGEVDRFEQLVGVKAMVA